MPDNQLVLILQNMLLTPSSDFYMSSLFYSDDKQSLDPRVIEHINMGVFEILGSEISIEVYDVEVKGCSNTQVRFNAQGAPDIIVDGNVVSFIATHPNTQDGYQRPPYVPAQIQGDGRLLIKINGELMPEGRLGFTVKTVKEIRGVFNAVEEVAGQLETAKVTFSSLSFLPETGSGNIEVKAELDTAFITIINQMLNRESSLQRLADEMNNHLALPPSLTALSNVATQYARQALGDFKASPLTPLAQADTDPDSDFAIRLPYTFINSKIKDYYPDLKSALSGTLTDTALDLTVNWSINEFPTIVAPLTEELEFFMDITVFAGMNTVATITAYCNLMIIIEQDKEYCVLKSLGDPYLSFTPHDPFVVAIFNNKMSEFNQAIQNMLGVFRFKSALPPIFPPMNPFLFNRYPLGSSTPNETIGIAGMEGRQNSGARTQPVAKLSEASVSAFDNSFRVQINVRTLDKIVDTLFWKDMDKTFSQSGATLQLDRFTLELAGDYLALLINLSGRVKVDIPVLPDPEWWIDFSAPLDIHLQVYEASTGEVRLRFSSAHFPAFELKPYNGAAQAYDHLLPMIGDAVRYEVGQGLISSVKALVDDIDEFLFRVEPYTYTIKDKSVTVTPNILNIGTSGHPSAPYLTFAIDFGLAVDTH